MFVAFCQVDGLGFGNAGLIGKQGYSGNVHPLKSPFNNIATVGKALTSVGFKVTTLQDAGRRQMLSTVKTFAAKLARCGQFTLLFGPRGCPSRGPLPRRGADLKHEPEAAQQAANAAMKKYDEEVRTKLEADRQRLVILRQQGGDKKRRVDETREAAKSSEEQRLASVKAIEAASDTKPKDAQEPTINAAIGPKAADRDKACRLRSGNGRR